MGEDVESFRMSSDQRDYASSRKGACWGASGISCPHTQSGRPRFCTMTQFLHSTVGLQWFRNYSGWYTSKDSEDQRNLSAHRTRQNTRFTWSSNPQSYRNHTAMILSWKFIFKNMDISSWGLKRLAIRAQFKNLHIWWYSVASSLHQWARCVLCLCNGLFAHLERHCNCLDVCTGIRASYASTQKTSGNVLNIWERRC